MYTTANAPRPTVSVPTMAATNAGARISRRVASSISRPQLPLRRHDTAGRARSAGP